VSLGQGKKAIHEKKKEKSPIFRKENLGGEKENAIS